MTPRRFCVKSPTTDAGWSSLVARRAHNPKVVGSNPAPATKSRKGHSPEWPLSFLLAAVSRGKPLIQKNYWLTASHLRVEWPTSDAGWSSLVARRAHNPKVVGSNPAPATKSRKGHSPEWPFSLLREKHSRPPSAWLKVGALDYRHRFESPVRSQHGLFPLTLQSPVHRPALGHAAADRGGLCLHRTQGQLPQGQRHPRRPQVLALRPRPVHLRPGLAAPARPPDGQDAGDPAGTAGLADRHGPPDAPRPLRPDDRHAAAGLAAAQRRGQAGALLRHRAAHAGAAEPQPGGKHRGTARVRRPGGLLADRPARRCRPVPPLCQPRQHPDPHAAGPRLKSSAAGPARTVAGPAFLPAALAKRARHR
ncbi:hypothetical protein OF001_U140005 [Pseudomonas sp. OF001]|nr:hypothetical protein OF001_U140005 [Pseudomonas sp. OF001]